MKALELKALQGTIFGFISFMVNMVYSIALVPFFLTCWGQLKYGQFLGFYSIILLMRTLDAGHQNYIGNLFNLQFHTDKAQAQQTLASSIFIAVSIGLLEIIVFLISWRLGLIDRILGADAHLGTGIMLGMLSMMIMWWLVGSVGGILVKAIMAKGYFPEATKLAIIMRGLEIVVIGIAIWTRMHIGFLFLTLAIVCFIFSAVVLKWVQIKMPEFFPWWKGFSIKTGFQNLIKSIVFTVNGFLDQISTTGLIFIISHFLTVAMIPVYTTIRTLTNTMSSVTNILLDPLIPEIIRFHGEKNTFKVKRVLQTNRFFSGILVNFGFVILIIIVDPLYLLWTNHQLTLDKSLLYLMMLAIVYYNYGRTFIVYLQSINDLKVISIIAWVKAITILTISVIGIKYMGLTAVGLAVLAGEIVASLLLPQFFIRSYMEMEWKRTISGILNQMPLVIMTLCIFTVIQFEAYKWIVAGMTMLLLIMVYSLLWKQMDVEIKTRILALRQKYRLKN